MNTTPNTKARVLFVDDSRLMRKAALKMLGDEFDVVIAEDGIEAQELLANDDTIQVLFTDLTMPRCDGYELLSSIRTSTELGRQNMPVIVVTGADNDEAARKKALDMGATDFVTKPFTSIDMLARARAHVNHQRITQQLQTQTTLDVLTGLSNKAGLLNRLQQDISYARRHQHELMLVRLEIDDLQKVFLEQGKQYAEAMVLHVAQLLRAQFRKEDTAARTGLGSFMLALPGGSQVGVETMLERFQAEAISTPLLVNNLVLPLAFTVMSYGPDVQSGVSAEQAFLDCESRFQIIRKVKLEPLPAEVAVEVEVPVPVPVPVETVAAMPPAPEEPIRVDVVLDQIKQGDTQTALKTMPQIIKRLIPLLRLLSAGQRAQLIQFLQKI